MAWSCNSAQRYYYSDAYLRATRRRMYGVRMRSCDSACQPACTDYPAADQSTVRRRPAIRCTSADASVRSSVRSLRPSVLPPVRSSVRHRPSKRAHVVHRRRTPVHSPHISALSLPAAAVSPNTTSRPHPAIVSTATARPRPRRSTLQRTRQ